MGMPSTKLPLRWTTTLLLGLLTVMVINGQQFPTFGRGFYASLDEAVNGAVGGEPLLHETTTQSFRQMEERLTNICNDQFVTLRARVEQLEKSVREMRHAMAHDWNSTDSGSLYKIFTTKKSWEDAQALCRLFGSQLAVIDSEYKNDYVRDMIIAQFNSGANNADQHREVGADEDTPTTTTASTTTAADAAAASSSESSVNELWIGLKTRAEMVGFGRPQSYTNFYDEEKIDGCTTVDRRGKWKIRPCGVARHFICQQINVL